MGGATVVLRKGLPATNDAGRRAGSSAGTKPVHLVHAGWFPGGDEDRKRYQEAANQLAGTMHCHFVDGNDPAVVGACWAAADVFLSLVDNIQETFRLTPIEAMAAGLPVVVSDWDGYRYTVRDGETGFQFQRWGDLLMEPGR